MRQWQYAVAMVLSLAGPASAETFDAATFDLPDGLKIVERDATHLVLASKDTKDGESARIVLEPLQPPKGSLAKDFDERWKAIAAEARLVPVSEAETVRTMTYRNGIAVDRDGHQRYVALATLQAGNCVMVARQDVTPVDAAGVLSMDFIELLLSTEVAERASCGAP